MELCYDLSISSPIPGTFTDAENLQLQGFRVYMSSGLPRMALEVTEDNLPPDGMLMTKWGGGEVCCSRGLLHLHHDAR